MKRILLIIALGSLFIGRINAQVEQYDPACSTPDLDSATAVSLPWYNNNQFLENYLIQKGYNNLPQISFPSPAARTTTTTFLEPMFLVPLNIYIYRDGANDPASSIDESNARDYVCRVNEIFRNAGTAIQFYVNRLEFEANNYFNQNISGAFEVYDLWSRKRYIPYPPEGLGINVHFIRYNNAPENNAGKASLPYYPVLPYSYYSLYVRTHEVYSNGARGGKRSPIENAATLAHEIGHTLSLLHTHHPGRLPSLIFNEANATISNGCYQESVSRVKSNYWYNGCFSTDGLAKCGINGDFLCDTDADPKQSGRVSSGCTYIHPASGDWRTDNWDDLWTPPTRNVMSYSNSDCMNQFSRHQTAIMWRQMEHFRQYIAYQPPTVVSNSDIVCYSNNTAFTLSFNHLPTDATVTWVVEPASMVSVANGTGLTSTLSASSGQAQGQIKIIYSIIGANNCYIARVQKTAWVGSPKADNTTLIWTGVRGTNPVTLSAGSINNYQVDAIPYTTSYSWILPSGFSAYGPSTTTPFPYLSIFTGNINGTYSLLCRLENSCGSSYAKSLTINVVGGSGGGGGGCRGCGGGGGGGGIQLRAAYPNPTNEVLYVQVKDESNEVISEVSLLNKSLETVYITKTSEKEIVIPTANLPPGIYYINISIGKETIKKQIVVNH